MKKAALFIGVVLIPLLAGAVDMVKVVGPVGVKNADGTTFTVKGPVTNTELRATPLAVGIGDTANLDAFSRLRVSNPTILFEATNVTAFADTMESTAAVSGTVVYIATASRVELRTTAASGSRAVLQSHGYILYQPGRSQLCLFTGKFGDENGAFDPNPAQNNIQRIGLFDDDDGLFFERSQAGGMNIVRRSSVGGSVTDTKVTQMLWNIDKLDGNGPSGANIYDWTKGHIYVIDFQWLGLGRVRFGIDIDGQIVYVHELLHAGSVSDVYMKTANLPVRYENINTGASGPSTLHAICAAVLSEGGTEEASGIIFSTSTKIVTVNATTTGASIIAIRPTSGTRHFILPSAVDLMAAGNIYFEVVYNGTLAGGTWAAAPGSSVDVNLGATYTAGSGKVLLSGYIGTSGGASRGIGNAVFPAVRGRFANNIAGTTGDRLAIIIYSFTGTVATSASMEWVERR